MNWLDRPQKWLNYSGDRRNMIGRICGPTALGEHWKAVACEFDQVNNRSRVGFRPATFAEVTGQAAS